MRKLELTDHGAIRLAQRNINDPDLIELVGTEVDDGYLVSDKDYLEIERTFKEVLQRVRRLRGARLVVQSGRVVTGYRATEKCKRRLLRQRRGAVTERRG